MKKIMFVCTGNICRSPMAEALLKNKIKNDETLRDKMSVYSCGMDAEEDRHATAAAIQIMEEYGIDMTEHRTTHIDYSDIQDMDLILCAETGHKEYILKYYPELRGKKIYTLKEYTGNPGYDMNISDPWGGSLNTYRQCAAEIEACLDKLIVKETGAIHHTI